MTSGNGLDQKATQHGCSVPLNPKMELNLKTTAALKITNYVYHFPAHGPAYVLSTTISGKMLSLPQSLRLFVTWSLSPSAPSLYMCACVYTHTHIYKCLKILFKTREEHLTSPWSK